MTISGNEVYDCKLGSSESVVVNGNVGGFAITRNSIHDNNNIGIDVIGYEGKASDPSVDVARDGVVSDNLVYNIDSYGNPAYGTDRSANGTRLRGASVHSAGDHRIAMALVVAGLVADGSTVVDDTGCIATSFPGFVQALNALAGRPCAVTSP